ncbi:carboxypeptidase-like regulatory domain-containing protein [Paenibacillus oryzisoli]|uniref:carboxypeptidase-like regulatory domain-containing protein n=1 Tax=Paenibacillus oryzisoli TaxID=1850517 RepID=UPI003D26C8FA
MKRFGNYAVFLLLTLFFGTFATLVPAASASVASGRASVNVTVSSSYGYQLSSSSVTLTSQALSFPITLRTNASGKANIPNLPVGDYALTASASGHTASQPVNVTLAAGQTFDYTFTLVGDDAAMGLGFFNPNNYSQDATQFQGTVSWSTYGPIPLHSEMQLQFLDAQNGQVGAVIASMYTSSNTNNYSTDVSAMAIPSGATRIGVALLNESGNVIATQTAPIWNFGRHSATAFKFLDTDPIGGGIHAVVTWSGAPNEAFLAGYKLFYWVKGESIWSYWDSVAKQEPGTGTAGTYAYAFDTLPDKTIAILIGSVNGNGEEINSYPTVSVIDNRLGDVNLDVDYPGSLPAPANIQDNMYSLVPGTVSGQFNFTVPANHSQINGYNLYFVDAAGRKLQAIGRIDVPDSHMQEIYNFNDNQPIPCGAAQFALYSYGVDGEDTFESEPVLFPIRTLNGVPSTAGCVHFVDLDAQENLLHGLLTWQPATSTAGYSSYQIDFLDSAQHFVSNIGEVPTGAEATFAVPRGLGIPSGAAQIGVRLKDSQGHTSDYLTAFPIMDNQSDEQVRTAVREAYFPGAYPIGLTAITGVLLQPGGAAAYDRMDAELLLTLIDSTLGPR